MIVGISEYKNVQSLEYSDKDARNFYYFLRSPAGGSVDSSNIVLLTNQKATGAQIISALNWLVDKSNKGDLDIFYFSGHGDVETKTSRKNGFLLAYDSPHKQ